MILLLRRVRKELIQFAQLRLADLRQHAHQVLLRVDAMPLESEKEISTYNKHRNQFEVLITGTNPLLRVFQRPGPPAWPKGWERAGRESD